MSDKPDQPFSRVTLGVAVGLAAVLVLGVILASVALRGDGDAGDQAAPTTTAPPRTGPLALVAVDAPDANAPGCTGLIPALPKELANKGGTLTRLALADPAPPAAAAWAGDRGEPVVLRCGLGKPAELTATARLKTVGKVTWLPVEGAGAITWYTVDRTVYIALTVPADTGTGPLQDMSTTIATAVPPA